MRDFYFFTQRIKCLYLEFIFFVFCFISIGGFSAYTHANYSPRTYYNSGYKIRLNSNGVDTTSIRASNGDVYYRLKHIPTIYGNGSGSEGVTASGSFKCLGKVWGGGDNSKVPPNNAWHRIFILNGSLWDRATIEGREMYPISNHLMMTIEAKSSTATLVWKNIKEYICAEGVDRDYYVHAINSLYPIQFRFYVKATIDNNNISVPSMDLGGYSVVFLTNNNSSGSLPDFITRPTDVSIPFKLVGGNKIELPSSCSTTTSTGQATTLNLRHGQLNSKKYDSLVKENIIYNCLFSKRTLVNLKLEYDADSDDSQKLLPLVNTKNNNQKIYTKLQLIDESTGKTSDKDNRLKVEIDQYKTITVTSHLQGENAVAGDYQGSAWLIATFD